jgi:hypothetical protein
MSSPGNCSAPQDCFPTPLFILVLLLVAAGTAAQSSSVRFLEATPFVDEFGSAGLLNLRAQVPSNSLVTLQVKTDLSTRAWTDFGPPILSPCGTSPYFTAPYVGGSNDLIPRQSFYRLVVETFDIPVSDDGRLVSVRTSNAVPAGLLFEALSLGTGVGFFGTTGVDPFTLVPPLDLSAANAEDLLTQAGFRVWVTPSRGDDTNEANRLLGNSSLQINPRPPNTNDIGQGRIEGGFNGIPGLPVPPRGPPDPPTPGDNADKRLVVDVPPAGDGVRQTPDPNFREVGRHIRLAVDVFFDGPIKATFAAECPGDALLPGAPSGLETDDLIYVVRSPEARGQPEQIYFMGALPNPFQVRAYDPPERGAHDGPMSDGIKVRIPVPILESDVDLNGLSVELHRVEKPIGDVSLTPDEFVRYRPNFRRLGEITIDAIKDLLGQILPPPPATLTVLHTSGSRASKFNMVVMGDGFQNTTTDQNTFNTYVTNVVLNDFFHRDIHPEILNAMNVYRINTFSVDSGVTQVDSNGMVTLSRDTALAYRYSGLWKRCWMEGRTNEPSTTTLIEDIVNVLLPETDVIAVVLNQGGPGGCSGSVRFAVTRLSPWSTFAHEFGHFFGKQGDEYQCNQGGANCNAYTNVEPGKVNLTTNTVRSAIKWNQWIPSFRPVPTAYANITNTTQDAGVFPGATTSSKKWWTGIYRPSWRGRMNDNSPPHSPIGYTKVREEGRPRQDGDFRKSAVGDFDGDGKTDLVILDDRQLSLYLARERDVGDRDPITCYPPRAVTGVLHPTWYHTDILYNSSHTRSWEFRGSDILLPGDFDGDGKTDLYIANLTAWNISYLCLLKSNGTNFEPVARYDGELPGWDAMLDHDEFYVGDFTGDGSADLMVFNGQDWVMPYFGMLRSTGTTLAFSRRYDQYLPGWEMGRHEKFFVGDFNGDGRREVLTQNRDDWNQVHLMVFTSTGTALSLADRHYGTIEFPFWTMRRQDELSILDFNADGRSDLAIFNGRDWTPEYLALFSCNTNAVLDGRRRYEDAIPGWDMNRRDRFYVADFDGDGDQDLVVYNGVNWVTEYLGMLRSDGASNLSGSWQDDWIGSWNLGDGDAFYAADFRGNQDWEDLFVYNKNWFGLLRSKKNRYQLETIYPKWIHNHRFHASGWW